MEWIITFMLTFSNNNEAVSLFSVSILIW